MSPGLPQKDLGNRRQGATGHLVESMPSGQAPGGWPHSVHSFLSRVFSKTLLLAASILAWAGPLGAQQPPPAPVRYTEARQHTLRSEVRLPGSVESSTESVIAGEVDGLVVEFPVREGDRIQKGQVLARLRTANLELRLRAAEADLREAEARLKLAERNLERAQELFDSKVFSQQELDQPFYESVALRGRVERLRADIDLTRDDIERCTIQAPFPGVVVAERTEVGQWLGRGDPVVELMSTEDLEVSVDVPELHFAQLRVNTRVTIEFEALRGRAVPGAVSAVIPRADPEARTFPIKVRFANPGGQAAPGMLAQVSFPGGEPHSATIVPKDGLVLSGSEQMVFVIDDDNTAKPIPVRAGTGVRDWVEVRGPVQAGQRIITRGNERLRPGQAVAGEPLEYKLP